jgi:hypothetical protein
MQAKTFLTRVSLLLFLLLPVISPAQTTGDVVMAGDSVQNAYVGNFRYNFMVKNFMATRHLSFNIRSRTGQRKSVTYSPNGNYSLGAGFFYKKVGLEFAFKLPVSDRNNERFGRTRYLDWQTNIYGTRFGGDLTYQRYRGFYPREPALLDSTWRSGRNYPYRSDIVARNMAVNAFYIFNHKRFSYKAAFTQTEKQLQSAGSFILMAAFSHLRFNGNSDLLPGSESGQAEEDASFKQGSFSTTSILPGYAYTFILDDFYLSGSVHLGGSLQYKNYVINHTAQQEFSLARKNHMRIAGGYNGQRWMAGTSVILDNTPVRMQQIVLSASNFNVKLFIGYRFNASSVDERIDRHIKKLKTKYQPE